MELRRGELIFTMFLTEIKYMQLINDRLDICNKMDRLLFQDHQMSVRNMSCDELNDKIEEYIEKKIKQGNVISNLFYIIKKYGTDQMNVTINMPARNIIYEMVAHKEDILKNISNSERS